MRLVRKDREKMLVELYEARLEERDRLVRILAEQVEYLRGQLHAPTATVGMALAPRTPVETPEDGTTYEVIPAFGGDDRDEIEAMHQAGVIDDAEYEQALAQLSSGSNIIE